MPAAAAGVVVGAIASGVASGIALGVGFSLTAFAGSLVLGAISYALTPKPKKPNFDQNVKGGNVAVRQSDLTRQYIYGHTRVTRGYAHMQSTGLNGTLHMILILAEGELRAINEIWVNDYVIPQDWISAEGTVTTGRYAGFMTIRKHLGGQFQAADTSAITNMPIWTSDHRLQGSAYLYITMTKDQDVYPTGIPNISAIVEGMSVYDPRTEQNEWSTNIALYARDYITNGKYGFAAFDQDIDDVNIAAQANICDEIVDTENSDSEVTEINISSDQIAFTGDMLKLQFGDRVQVITDGDYPGGISSGTDYYVIPYQIKTNPRIQLATSLDNAMNKIAINITSTGNGDMYVRKTGEPRYHGGGILESENTLSQNLNDIVSSMAGRAVCIGGFWTLIAGAWRSPTITLEIGDVRGNALTFKNSLSMSESFNEVKGVFVSSETFYQVSDYPSATYQQFVDQDNGLLSTKELNLPFSNRATTAQRIAKIELFRGRQDITVQSMFSTKALQLQPGDTVNLEIERYGWEPKIFEVTEFSFDVNDGNLVTKMSLRETAEQIYDWSQGEAIDFDPAPNTNMPSPFNVLVPTGVGYNSRMADTSGGETLYIMQMEWDPHPDAFVRQFGDFELQFKKSSDVEWLPSFFVAGVLTKTDLFTSQIGIPYDLRIRARNNLGVRSGWVTILGAVVGSSGGVGSTEDWETFTDPEIYFEDWETFSDPVVYTDDWGYFT